MGGVEELWVIMFVLKAIFSIVGILVMLLGVVIAPLPGPMGLPVVLLGLIITLRFSPLAKRLFVRLVKRYPKVFGPLRRALRRRAKVLAIMWHQMLRTERFFTRLIGWGRLRLLSSFRKLFRRRRARPAAALKLLSKV
jgi:uncharacterized membrane protein YbaN (DUF454 family)